MEEDFEASSNAKTYLPLAVGIAGAALGIAALAFAINSASRASKLEAAVNSMRESLEASAKTPQEIRNLSDKTASAFKKIEAMEASCKINANAVSKQLQSAVNALSAEISNNRGLIAKNQEAIAELATRGIRASKASAAKPSSSAAQADAAPAAEKPQGGKIHKVKAGENFSVIAKKYGVNVQVIERANPEIDSRRLRIGQEIVIP
ncbi:MAG: LysM peptidoglycan-binding domain-containing protein [Opitutales bacterium]|nr:LysM peptidoglycan-binding domain-containing protein [Opitutales bacterium]